MKDILIELMDWITLIGEVEIACAICERKNVINDVK